MRPTSSASADPTPPIDERLRRAALAAALAAKAANANANPNVAGTAADAAASQGASPGEAASIAMTLERVMREAGPDAVTSDPTLQEASLAAAADSRSAETIPSAPAAVPNEDSGEPPVEEPRMLDALRDFAADRKWVPLASLAERCGASAEAVQSALATMRKEDFVRVENDHFFVTESGQRYLEFRALTKS